ncbi:MAG: DUF4397 domain-containing protein [Lachnospiraceae bacterium]|nr:DUF4397 domain-containing protein [Lachnospiraceae bacterium]
MRTINNLPLSGMSLRNVRNAAPAIPLPNPGEGGAVYPGNTMNGETDGQINDTDANNMGNGVNGNDGGFNNGSSNDGAAMPVIPLPNPGEGGAVFPGNGGNNNGNSNGNGGVAIPVIPLPNPGEGGAVFPGNSGNNNGNRPGNNFVPSIPGTVIITYPRPNDNCTFCNPGSNQNSQVRFLNAASGYNPFWVYINDKLLVNDFGFADITEYVEVAAGRPVITLMGENGYVYLQQPVEVSAGNTLTMAIVNTDSGLGLKVISDTNCDRNRNASCIRVGNLTYQGGPLNVVIGNRYVTFRNVNSGEVTDFATIWPGEYPYTVSRTNNTMYPVWGSNTLLQSALYLQRDKNYTIYLFQYNPSADAIKALIVED